MLSDRAVHEWFSLTYSSYLVLPRLWLESMPPKWQRDFVKLISQIPLTLDIDPEYTADYTVNYKVNNKFAHDKYKNYRRGTIARKINNSV